MNPQHIPYYGNGQLTEVPRHQIQHPGIPPGVPLVMNQPPGFTQYRVVVPRHSQPIYHSNPPQPPPQLLRHPPPMPRMPVAVAPQHTQVAEPVRVRFPVQPVPLNQHPVKPEVPPAPPPLVASVPIKVEETPLDLSAKPKVVKAAVQTPFDSKPVAHAAIVQIADQPLDLSKPLKQNDASNYTPAGMQTSNGDKRNASATTSGASSARGGGDHSGRLSANSSTTANDIEQELAGGQSMGSVSSLLGNHPPDDILYLYCARCQSSYGSVHAFRKHFRNSHGYMPNSEDVYIQSIKATKEYVMNKNESPSPASSSVPRRHCNYCGWQCEQTNPAIFSKHMREHYDVKGCFYRCVYCQHEFSDQNMLRQHVVQHNVIYPHICAFCCIAYSAEEQLANHMFTNHGMRYTSRKVNLPVSVVLPSPSTMASVKHDISPKFAPQGLTKMKSGYPQSYAEHIHSSTAQGKNGGSPHPQTLSNPNSFMHSPMQQKSAMLTSPRYGENSKVTSPSTGPLYKKHVAMSPGVASKPTSEAKEGGQAGGAPFNLMSLLDRVVEQGLKSADVKGSVPASNAMAVSRRPSNPAMPPAYEYGNRQHISNQPTSQMASPSLVQPAPFPAAHSTPSHPSGLIDLSCRPHTNPSATTPQPAPLYDPKARSYAPPFAITTVETIDLSNRLQSHVCTGQYGLTSPVHYQKRVHAHGCPTTASSSFSTRSTFALDQSSRKTFTERAPDQHRVSAHSAVKGSTATSIATKTPIVDITGSDSMDDITESVKLEKSVSVSTTLSGESATVKSNKPELPPEAEAAKNLSVKKDPDSSQTDEKIALDDEKRSADTSECSVKPSLSRSVSQVKDKVNCESPGDSQKVESGEKQPSKSGDQVLNFQVNTSTTTSSGETLISSIIERVVKNTLGTPEDSSKERKSTADQGKDDTKNNTSVSQSTASKINNTDAIPVSWAEKKDCEPSLEVDRIQAMSACKVLLSPHCFPPKKSESTSDAETTSGSRKRRISVDKNIGSPSARRRLTDSSYQTAENGALDMSRKCTSSQDHSDSSAASSPKRLRIVENE